MKITIEKSPFGDEGREYSGQLGMMEHYRLQLISYRDQPKTAEDRAFLEADIAGYEAVIASGSEKNAQAFMKNKRDEKHRRRHADNLKLIEWLKENGLWEADPAQESK